METTVDVMEITELWKNYKETYDNEFRNELVLKYSWLVKSIVRRISPISGSYTEAEDLNSYGIIGLIKAIEKFDLEKGVTFETFATYRIRGEMIDFMRRNDWVPRSVRKRILEVEDASSALINELGRQPTQTELGIKLGFEAGELTQTLSDRERFSLVSFEELIYDSVQVDSELVSDTPEGHLQEFELLEVLTKSLNELPERDRLIVTLYYFEELNLKEISGILGVSESRVSQIHSKAIEKMKKNLKAYINN